MINAFDLEDAWYKCVAECWRNGFEYTNDRGSFVGHKRKEFDNVIIRVSNPNNRPLIPTMLPEGIPPPTDMNFVNKYLQFLITGEKQDYEYTYGERINMMLREGKDVFSQLDKIIQILKETPNTNQATIAIARPEDVLLKDPPCLRLIDCRIRYGKLHFFVYFRSWDLWNGFPANMAALQLLKEYMAGQIGVEDGELIAWSKGLHLYDTAWVYAKQLVSEPDSEPDSIYCKKCRPNPLPTFLDQLPK